MKKFTIGVDVGGTNIKLGIVDAAGNILSQSRLSTESFIANKQHLIEAIVSAIRELIQKNNLTKKDITGIGIGLPGLIDYKGGMVIFLPNIPGWKNVPLKRIIEKKTGIKTFIDNDVNVIALGEWNYGVGKGYENLVYMTLGTGVGGGLILNNKLYRGEGFAAGEIGHIPLNEKGPACNCGSWGCFERYVGNQTLLSNLKRIFKKDVRIPEAFELANRGDKKALAFWQQTATHIGNGLIGVVNLLNPRLIVIGGGVSNNYKFFHKTVEKIIKQRAMKVQAKMVKIIRAKLGDSAGILGAQVLVNNALRER